MLGSKKTIVIFIYCVSIKVIASEYNKWYLQTVLILLNVETFY